MLGHHLLSIADLEREDIEEVLRVAESFAEVTSRPIPKVPALRGKTVATAFFESSTRTRLSFETAAKRLSADTMSFSAATSSLQKGESLYDTVRTLDALGTDALVVRHGSSGAAAQIARVVNASVINAGDGQHEHPTQSLTDCFTLAEAISLRDGSERTADFSGLRVVVIGDSRHSRVARSNTLAFSKLGASVTLVGPSTLLPPSLVGWPVEVCTDLDEALFEADVCYVLRLQTERMGQFLLPSLEEYHRRFALTEARAAKLKPDALLMHPGPMNRGVEIDDAVASSFRSLVDKQVKNGVAVRMAVLFLLLGGPGKDALEQVARDDAST